MAGRKERRFVGSFAAKDKDGQEYTIDIYQDFIYPASRDGTAPLGGLKTLRVHDDGQHVNYVEKGKYQTVELGIDLTCDDPKAP